MEKQYYYNASNGQIYSSAQMLGLFGINTETTSLQILNLDGFYPVQDSSPDFDLAIYNSTFVWALTPITGGQGAIRVYSPVPKPLPEAKIGATREAKEQSGEAAEFVRSESGLDIDILTAVASQAPVDRPARFQAELDLLTAISDDLSDTLDLIDAATTVDQINDILHPTPGGILFTGRGTGGVNENLIESYFVDFEPGSLGITEADTELYIPGSGTVISYGSGGAGKFAATPNAFAVGNYVMQVRVTATGQVVGNDIQVPYNPSGENRTF
jgi:hypothetical protein